MSRLDGKINVNNLAKSQRVFTYGSLDFDTPNYFISSWDTTKTSTGSSTTTQIKLPLIVSGNYDMTVYWGDGNSDYIDTYNQSEVTHTYSSSGTKTIHIRGICKGFQFNNGGDRLKFIDVSDWGKLELNTNSCFYGCSNLTGALFNGSPTITTTSLYQMFRDCTNFNGNINSWDVSNVTNMGYAFRDASSFDQDIGNWDVSNVSYFAFTFRGALSFNNGGSSSINNWTIRNSGSNFSFMFQNAPSFNQPLNNWNVSNTGDFSWMFSGATIWEQDIGSWDISGMSDASYMFFNITLNSSNYDALLNGWIQSDDINTGVSFYGGQSTKYTSAASESRGLFTRTNITLSISNAVDNGSGLIRITSGVHGLSTNNKIRITDVVGTTEANGLWVVTVINTTTLDLQSSTFTNTYTSGGSLRTGYGWTITDGGI